MRARARARVCVCVRAGMQAGANARRWVRVCACVRACHTQARGPRIAEHCATGNTQCYAGALCHGQYPVLCRRRLYTGPCLLIIAAWLATIGACARLQRRPEQLGDDRRVERERRRRRATLEDVGVHVGVDALRVGDVPQHHLRAAVCVRRPHACVSHAASAVTASAAQLRPSRVLRVPLEYPEARRYSDGRRHTSQLCSDDSPKRSFSSSMCSTCPPR